MTKTDTALLANGLVTGYVLSNSTLSTTAILICYTVLLITMVIITKKEKEN